MLEVVKISVMSQTVTQIYSHALPDLECTLIPGFQFVLNELELIGIGYSHRDFDAGLGCEPKDTLL